MKTDDDIDVMVDVLEDAPAPEEDWLAEQVQLITLEDGFA
jgi:hypothetical protein